MKITTAWMLCVALLLFINYASCHTRDLIPSTKAKFDEDTDQIFTELQKQLDELETLKNDERTKKSVTDGAEDSKDAIKKLNDPNHIMKALDVVKGIGPNLAKFKSGDSYDIAEGAFGIIAAVTAALPPPVGPALSAVASLVSGIIPLFKPAAKDKQIIATMLKNILREENDELLKSEVNGFKEELESALAAISTTTEFESDTSMRLYTNKIPPNYGANILGKVGHRIQDRAGDDTTSGGKGAYGLAIAFVQLATYRDLGLMKMMTILVKSGETGKEIAGGYQNALDQNRDTFYQRHLSFFHAPSLAVAQTMVHYYPPGHNRQSKFLYSFLKANGINEPSTVPTGNYVIKSKYWPAYYLRRSFTADFTDGLSIRILYSVSYNSDTPTTKDKILLTKKHNGYYSFKFVDPRFTEHETYRYATYNSRDKFLPYVRVAENPPSTYGDFVIIKYADPKGTVVTIAEKRSPTKLWNGGSNKWAVYPAELDEENKNKAPFILLNCNTSEGSECPDWN
ncbi:toxin CfTX-B-like [Hydractinia symbiolongicarpus]|uniref:toxin CfTX-B-like n=1 Tax=Hydractinia symbiolongicarpus TaxID=13093 RepID=UPI00254D2D74|nr:toxin CfTX-B-like [Hydractinia symbiolongicarpus]